MDFEFFKPPTEPDADVAAEPPTKDQLLEHLEREFWYAQQAGDEVSCADLDRTYKAVKGAEDDESARGAYYDIWAASEPA